ncbi:hypothetical protein FD755_016759, partial [Muntiacus reevesi]
RLCSRGADSAHSSTPSPSRRAVHHIPHLQASVERLHPKCGGPAPTSTHAGAEASVQAEGHCPEGGGAQELPCPSLSSGVCSNSCPLSQCCHPTVSSSLASSSSCPQSFQASGEDDTKRASGLGKKERNRQGRQVCVVGVNTLRRVVEGSECLPPRQGRTDSRPKNKQEHPSWVILPSSPPLPSPHKQSEILSIAVCPEEISPVLPDDLVGWNGVGRGGRVCLLVQDALGLFSEVRSEGDVLKDRQLEGKCCRLSGMKVLQKVTRASAFTFYFCLHFKQEKTHLPPPSFCYILSAHPDVGQIDVIEDDPVAELYQPPTPRFLKEILQTDGLCTHCSFYARVIYRRPQANSLPLEPREMWLVVTDITLQTLDKDSGLPRTVPVRVAASCLLDQEVRDALCEATSQSFLFRDALQDQGQIVCVSRTVLLPLKPCGGMMVGAWELTGPLHLDELGPGTRVNSICSMQGTVVAVDESTACSWPVCDLCGSERLERSPADSRGAFYCGDCSRMVTSPVLRRHLQVFLDAPSQPQCTVRVKLLGALLSSPCPSCAGHHQRSNSGGSARSLLPPLTYTFPFRSQG